MAGGHTDALELLLDFKASVATADGRTPLVRIAAALEGEKQASRAPLLRSLIGAKSPMDGERGKPPRDALVAAGVTAQELRAAGYECAEARVAGYAAGEAKAGGYSLAALDADVELMMRNAQTYNTPDSQVYHDASSLRDIYQRERAKLVAS